MRRYSIDNLIIEVTRRCNMACPHCMRGDAQKMDLDIEHVRRLFDRVSEIHTLTFTGGEPSLVPHIIDEIIEEARARGINIGNFYIATNGKDVSAEFSQVLMKLWWYCSDNEISSVDISNDAYHEYDPDYLEKLSALRFVGKRTDEDYKDYRGSMISMGRAAYMGTRYPSVEEMDLDTEYGSISAGEFYLNCKGNILGCCDLSYQLQDDPRLIVCNVESLDELETACAAYDQRLEKVKEVIESGPYYELEDAA